MIVTNKRRHGLIIIPVMMMIIMIIVSYTYMWGCKTKNWVLPWNKGVSPGHNSFTPRKKTWFYMNRCDLPMKTCYIIQPTRSREVNIKHGEWTTTKDGWNQYYGELINKHLSFWPKTWGSRSKKTCLVSPQNLPLYGHRSNFPSSAGSCSKGNCSSCSRFWNHRRKLASENQM